MIVDPRGISFADWSASLVTDLPTIPYVQYTGGSWQDWAAQYSNTPALGQFNIPNPYNYQDWKMWAFEFIRNLL